MDPKATLQDWIEGTAQALEASANLMHWLDRNGYQPRVQIIPCDEEQEVESNWTEGTIVSMSTNRQVSFVPIGIPDRTHRSPERMHLTAVLHSDFGPCFFNADRDTYFYMEVL